MLNDRILLLLICFGALVLLALVLGFILLWRYLSYRQALDLAEKGLPPPPPAGDGKNTLRWGIILTALGLALSIGLIPLGYQYRYIYPLGLGPWVLLGLLPLFFGLALILIYLLTKK